ncbi:MAG: 50S ribosomal protein L24 [bacterium]|nr:50S ribosomal protein L24 [bacterium]
MKLNDSVVIISGSDRGRRGKVLHIDRRDGRVIVEGINKKQKYVRPTQENPKGGVLKKEFPIDISNVMLFCEKCKKGVRIEIKVNEKSKSRNCKKCGKSLD